MTLSSTDARARAREQKNLDHVIFLKANELMLARKKCEQKNLDHIGSLKASELVAPMLERERANRKILITFLF